MIIDIDIRPTEYKPKKGDFILIEENNSNLLVYIIVCDGLEGHFNSEYKVLCLNSNQVLTVFNNKTVYGLIEEVRNRFAKDGEIITVVPQEEFKITRIQGGAK